MMTFAAIVLGLGLAVVLLLLAAWLWSSWQIRGMPKAKEREAGTYARHFVYVNDDGSVRELTTDDTDYLNTTFLWNDSAQPYIKDRYTSRTPDGLLHGYLLRSRLPKGTEILDS